MRSVWPVSRGVGGSKKVIRLLGGSSPTIPPKLKSSRTWGAVTAIAIPLALVGCDDVSPRAGHWIAYATETTSRKTIWIFPFHNFVSADDCDHAVRIHIITKQDGGFYDFPVGCAYYGSSRYWAWLINVVYQKVGYSQPAAFECLVSRSTNSETQAAGLTYGPAIRGSPREGVGYYCVL
jgi:hypothetical protein